MKNTPKTNHSINYPINYNGLQKTAIQAAHASGKVLMKYFRKKITVNVKPDLGLVTNARAKRNVAGHLDFRSARWNDQLRAWASTFLRVHCS